MSDHAQTLRILEAVLFAAREPLDDASLAARLPEGSDLPALLADLQAHYAGRGVNLVRVNERWTLRTATDLAAYLQTEVTIPRKLSRAALESLAIIAYHQPVSRAEIEDIRGVSVNKGTIDLLLEAGWIRPGRRRETPGRPLTWLTTGAFLEQFGLESLEALPGIEELKATGLLDKRPAIHAIEGGRGDGPENGADSRPPLPDEAEEGAIAESDDDLDESQESLRD
ncbi:MAG: SMC-Scp complex subunit ScpB [Alphaproteobacteria bacterium]